MKIILASASPRRKELLAQMGIAFEVVVKKVEEHYPAHLSIQEIPVFIAQQKAKAFENELDEEQLVLAADTIVALENEVLGKPKDADEAIRMLSLLSGKQHQVCTGVCLRTKNCEKTMVDTTLVSFKTLSKEEIRYYVEKYQPFDKAGAYGIQEWIGLIGITKIEGSFYNVMGLPTEKLYAALEAMGFFE